MSRIGNLVIPLPSGIQVTQTGAELKVEGPRGVLVRQIPQTLLVELSEASIRVMPKPGGNRFIKAIHGLYRQLIANMVAGVQDGFTKKLEMKGTGYRAEVQGKDLVLSVGFSHPVKITAPEGIEFKVEKNVQITISGNDKERVGAIAADIRSVRKPEPYKGKGIRYAGEHIRLKPGKAAKAAAS